jgi:DNA adenine methylase
MRLNSKLFDWIGGKSWLSNKLKDKFHHILIGDKKIKNYAEPFCGSLGSLMNSTEILINNGIETIHLNDINKTVINTFRYVKNSPILLFEEYKRIEEQHVSLIPDECFLLNKTRDKIKVKELMKKSNEFYIEKRKIFNNVKEEDSIESCATFLFLMGRSFNGIYRENKSGLFNSPYGWTNKKINMENKKESILNFSNFFNNMNVEFYNLNCFEFLEKMESIKDNTLFYFDPPYLNQEIKENSYDKSEFGQTEQVKLLNKISNLRNVVYSNHNVKIIRDFFDCSNDYEIEVVYRKNNMSSKNSNRSNDVPELLVTKK